MHTQHTHPILHQNVPLIHRFPLPANPRPPGRPRKMMTWQSSSVLGPPPRLRQELLIQQLRPLSSDQDLPTDQRPANSQTARAVAQQQRCPNGERRRTPDRQRPVATRTARPVSPPLHLVSVWQSSGVAPGVINVVIGDSMARPIKPDLVFLGGSEPEPQRLWPNHRRRQPLAGQHPQE